MEKNRTGLIVGIGLAAILVVSLLVVALFCFVVVPQGVISEGNAKEATLSGDYADGANYLSKCITSTKQAAQAAQANTDALDRVIADAVNGQVSGRQVNLNTTSGQQFLLTAMHQAYPDLSGLNTTFQNVLIVITGCQTDFQTKQSAVLDDVRHFNSWRTDTWRVRTFGGSQFPNDNLYIRIPGVPTATGQTALDTMEQPIVNSAVSGAYKSGTYTPENPFAPPTPSPRG